MISSLAPAPASTATIPAEPRSGAAHRFALVVLVANVGVVLWGAVVRATGSGAGCGSHWPLCNGEVVPLARPVKTMIELSHRVTSGLGLLLVVALVVVCRRAYPQGHPARAAAWSSLAMVGTEALIGAFIVLAGLVALDPSAAHGIAVGLHLVSTFLLLSALGTTVACTGGVERVSLRGQSRGIWILALLPLVSLLIVGSLGAINALGDTLYPVPTVAAGIALDRADAAPLFVRMRIWHPVVATLAVIVISTCPPILERVRPSPLLRKASRAALFLVLGQWVLGLLNLSLLAPVPIQILHLLVADALWLSLSCVALAAFAVSPARTPVRQRGAPGEESKAGPQKGGSMLG